MTRISIVEDQKDVADNIVKMINATPNMSAVGVYYSAEEAIAALPADRADIVLMDIVLPGMNGLECMVRLKDLMPNLSFLMFTAFDDDPLLFDALRFGASGYILKEERFFGIMRAINAHLKGEVPISPRIAHKILTFFQNQEAATSSKKKIRDEGNTIKQLTSRQNEIVSLVAKGLTDKEVANRLGITNGTCRRHVSACLQRLHLANRTELALRWKELND